MGNVNFDHLSRATGLSRDELMDEFGDHLDECSDQEDAADAYLGDTVTNLMQPGDGGSRTRRHPTLDQLRSAWDSGF